MTTKRIALLHLNSIAGELEHNRRLIELGVTTALEQKADWIITPETAVSGLQFSHLIGTDWIEPQPDVWACELGRRAGAEGAHLFLGLAEKGEDGLFYNVVVVLGVGGGTIGSQRKMLVHSDGWSTPGGDLSVVEINGIKAGIMICADAYTNRVANSHLTQGAQVLVAPSAWGPGLYGPEGEWEQRSRETGLPVFVCNRTGEDRTVKFWEAESLVIHQGERLLARKTRNSEVLIFEWDFAQQRLASEAFEIYILR
ncbi:carbon-nitrogen hydrolase family protein [Acidaminobacter hydrogenoformans]|uniref:N-carbamoylputrescine amidase n=1 Tax=Acidaminobacter hydrogenoformans DSM 2784 TaxID=1120920 RepID=A0A1G5RWP7_9FIRM|nr:carbon-nitrogen hydrolase family protein [Acidaminobacter hydrogenoformans]SCZ78160.1 N-carbamoylputrescine amidase [Acidaminobacter hydrogenoformans DSM 2784]